MRTTTLSTRKKRIGHREKLLTRTCTSNIGPADGDRQAKGPTGTIAPCLCRKLASPTAPHDAPHSPPHSNSRICKQKLSGPPRGLDRRLCRQANKPYSPNFDPPFSNQAPSKPASKQPARQLRGTSRHTPLCTQSHVFASKTLRAGFHNARGQVPLGDSTGGCAGKPTSPILQTRV